ncbi:MAG: amino acid ABC transporter ATP-binding protein [Hyphomicrobiales bacterium]|nr:amino acid ABC transporter ATP-binding protein [Hyphomicrobiales bacterium]
MTDQALRAENVVKSFGAVPVLRGVDLTLRSGEVACLIGASGSGKSTFLRCINQLETIDGGQIWVGDELMGYRVADHALHELPPREIARQRRLCGMVFQSYNLFPHMTALQNVIEAPIVVRGLSRDRAIADAQRLLSSVGLSDKLDAYPAHLSGGQQQRVAIARALAMEPKLMLFDEPTSALDPLLVGEVLDVMRDLADRGLSMIIVTHELNFAREVADSIAFMDAGRIVEHGPPGDVLERPAGERTRAFVTSVIGRAAG